MCDITPWRQQDIKLHTDIVLAERTCQGHHSITAKHHSTISACRNIMVTWEKIKGNWSEFTQIYFTRLEPGFEPLHYNVTQKRNPPHLEASAIITAVFLHSLIQVFPLLCLQSLLSVQICICIGLCVLGTVHYKAVGRCYSLPITDISTLCWSQKLLISFCSQWIGNFSLLVQSSLSLSLTRTN